MKSKKILKGICFCKFLIMVAVIVAFIPISVIAHDHLIITSQDASVGKEIAAYLPDGTHVFSHIPEGGVTDNTPAFIVPDPTTQRFLVTCPAPRTSTTPDNQSVRILDASDPYNITLVNTLHPGLRPFHAYLSPDGKFVVGNDSSDDIAIIDPVEPDSYDLIEAGHHHTTIVFAGDASQYDIYAGRFGDPGGMDIVDGDTLTVRTQITDLLPRPHSGVYSSYTERVYFGHMGGIEIFGTTGEEKDQHIGTIPMDEGQMIPLSRISPDGRFIYGGVHYDGEEGSYFYAVDLADDSVTTVPSVSCKYYAFSPDGKWLVAGDFNKPPSQTDFKVHVISTDPESPDFMTVVTEFSVSNSQIGFHTSAFSPDSRYAYLGLPDIDQIMVVDVEDLEASFLTLPSNSAPRWLRVLPLTSPLEPTAVSNWNFYQ